MKHIIALKAIIPFLILISVFSCEKNDDASVIEPESELIGDWQRSDFSDHFEYKLNFHIDNIGMRTQREGNLNDNVISNAKSFDWSINNDVLTLDFDGEVTITPFSINADGQLILSGLTELHFNRID